MVACDEEQIIGYIGMYQVMEEGDITNVAVRPDCQGQGVGSLLVEALFHRGGQAGNSGNHTGSAGGKCSCHPSIRKTWLLSGRTSKKLLRETAGRRFDYVEPKHPMIPYCKKYVESGTISMAQ